MTKKEIIYNILNVIEAGRIHDDFTPSFEQLSFIIDYKRAQYIRQDQTKNYFDSDQLYQDLGIFNMVKVDKSECADLTFDCDILRTELKLPSLLRLNDRIGVKISAIEKQSRFHIVLPERSPFLGNTKFPQLAYKVYFLNGYIYMPETLDVRAINIRGLLSKPKDASAFTCSGEACYTNSSEYPISSDMVDLITKDILSNELKMLIALASDETNDGQDKNNG